MSPDDLEMVRALVARLDARVDGVSAVTEATIGRLDKATEVLNNVVTAVPTALQKSEATTKDTLREALISLYREIDKRDAAVEEVNRRQDVAALRDREVISSGLQGHNERIGAIEYRGVGAVEQRAGIASWSGSVAAITAVGIALVALVKGFL